MFMVNKIGIDLIPTQVNQKNKFDGGNEYAKRIFHEIYKKAKNQKIYCFYTSQKYLLPEIKDKCNDSNFELIEINNADQLYNILEKFEIDKYYSALPNINFTFGKNIKYIYTIHGLRSIEMPTDKYEYLLANSPKDLLKYIFKNVFLKSYIKKQKDKYQQFLLGNKNQLIVVPSLHTKYSILEKFPELDSEDINVLYSPPKLANNNNNNNININKRFNLEGKKYFLLISGNRWRKNNFRALKAIDQIYSQNKNTEIKTLLLGANKISKIKSKLVNKNKFIFAGYVKTEELEELYKKAFLFIYPTLNEGFGYPPLEAMKYGTPVIASAISSVPEICGDAVLYFNPYSINEIKGRILQVVDNNDCQSKLKERGLEHYKNIKNKQNTMLDQLVEIILE